MNRRMDPRHMQTFSIKAPKETHTVPATCEEVECPMYLNGWKMKIDLATELGRGQAYYIKHHSGRAYQVESQIDGIVELVFKANQPCFREHRKRIERPEIFSVRGGDSRGNPLKIPTRVHKRAEFWVEEFAENQDRIARAIEKG